MIRLLTHPVVASIALVGISACISTREGTQIGVEHGLECAQVSSEVLVDLEAVPDGFTTSPRASIDALAGTFSGSQLDEQELPTADQASVTVADAGQDVVLQRFEPVSEDDVDPAHCPPTYTTDLTFTLESDGLPTFQATLSTRISHEGEAWAESDDLAHFDADLPVPTTFDPNDFDLVLPHVVLSGGHGDWWGYVSWYASNPDDYGAGEDVPVTDELMMMAQMQAE